ncbi:Esterase/lipase superfamily enzyme [Halopseudomonas sabulinigri]|uniref:Esterase/lipase superfamily enzyme n=2 Tax=Halopseudomonas sabulinigri TaxID=472181 RepID=A0A1H1MET2_9GAMM|nr:Esterase/lipase superfamily enzyme [Halopseudomonas sabulinigri]
MAMATSIPLLSLITDRAARSLRAVPSLALCVLLSACAAPQPLMLMPSPIIYQDGLIDPFAHLEETHRVPRMSIFYATNRAPEIDHDGLGYGNGITDQLHLGQAVVQLGDENTEWRDLYEASLTDQTGLLLPLALHSVTQQARLPLTPAEPADALAAEAKAYFAAINVELAVAQDREILVYVHGTKVGFVNSAALTAEIDHFSGRDYVGLAFAWPSHQNILRYLVRQDVHRAQDSSQALANLLQLLAQHTDAERINVLAYSAGARVTSKALDELRQLYADDSNYQLKRRLRIGTVVFAAADVELDSFLQRLGSVSDVAGQVVITVSDDDNALIAARHYMGGGNRAGEAQAESAEQFFILEHHITNIEIIDVSAGKQVRGFDIRGHHYWYRHPWISSDMVFLLRTGLRPDRRGLSYSEAEGIWYLAEDYPDQVRRAAQAEMVGKW